MTSQSPDHVPGALGATGFGPAGTLGTLDCAQARAVMVDGYLRPNKVTDTRILDAMRDLPRERFVPPALSGLAHLDEDLPLGGGRVLMDPLITARLVQLATPHTGERALVVGAGTGYLAALLARCGVHVTALEEEERLLALARAAYADPGCAGVAQQVRLLAGPLLAGDPQGAPYDVIVVQGAVAAMPDAYAGQLGRGGRLVGVIADAAGGHGVLGELAGGRVRLRPAFDCATPLLPQLRPVPAFTF